MLNKDNQVSAVAITPAIEETTEQTTQSVTESTTEVNIETEPVKITEQISVTTLEKNITEEVSVVTDTTTAKSNSRSTYYTEEDAINLAKVLYAECGGLKSKTEQACVAWVVCNRADYDNCSITQSAMKKGQFAYNANTPVTDELYDLAIDVLDRWSREKNGETDVGRVLPKEYGFFNGDGVRNYFRDKYDGDYNIWDYSLPSPYET